MVATIWASGTTADLKSALLGDGVATLTAPPGEAVQ